MKKLTEKKVRSIIREELNEMRGPNLSGVAERIYREVMRTMQEAEELGGPEGQNYIELMRAISQEAQKRIEVFRETQM
jgi:hypothetical protein